MTQRKKCAMVTGVRSGGTGQAISRWLALNGDRVLCVERDAQAGAEAVEELRAEGLDVCLFVADVSQPEEVATLFDSLEGKAEGLEILVNNAGHAGSPAIDNLQDSTPQAFESLFRANLFSAFLVTREAVQRYLFPQRRGRVVFISSNNGFVGALGQLAYGVAKQGLIGMARILAAEYAHAADLTFTVVSPGILETNSPNWVARRASDPEWARTEAFQNPSGRLGRPSDVAALVGFLVSSQASFISGCDIPIDGGLRSTGILFPGIDCSRFRESYVERFRSLVPQASAEMMV